MKHISAADFKATCLSLLDEVDADGIVITKRGKPVARLVPFTADSSELIGALAGRIQIRGDLLSTGADWHAES